MSPKAEGIGRGSQFFAFGFDLANCQGLGAKS
jgi:hypothetical protein